MQWRMIGLPVVVVATTLSMTVAEFVEFQKLSSEELRTRFGLPAGCEPSVTAATPHTGGNSVNVGVECRVAPGSQPSGSPRPARPSQRGS
jgi:hypothetical protein